MSFFDEFISSNGSALVKQLARNFNFDENATQAAAGSGGSTMSNMLTSMLDADGDGSVADDLLDMAKKFF